MILDEEDLMGPDSDFDWDFDWDFQWSPESSLIYFSMPNGWDTILQIEDNGNGYITLNYQNLKYMCNVWFQEKKLSHIQIYKYVGGTGAGDPILNLDLQDNNKTISDFLDIKYDIVFPSSDLKVKKFLDKILNLTAFF